MKKLSPVWFLRSPLDSEHKNYILLDFLKSTSEDIKNKSIYSPIKKIFSLIESLEKFSTRSFSFSTVEELSPEEEGILKFYLKNPPSNEERKEIETTIRTSLKILYKYSEGAISLWKDLESRIKIYTLKSEKTEKDKGITIFRNMSSNEIFSYWWKKVEMKIEGESKKGIILKKVPILNNYFSMSYEFILHETLVHMGIRDASSLPCTIIEISEDFNQSSEIFKIAKEKFIKEVEGD